MTKIPAQAELGRGTPRGKPRLTIAFSRLRVYVVARARVDQRNSVRGEDKVISRQLWSGVLIATLSVALSGSVEAQTGGGKIVSNGTIVGVIVGVIAAVVVVAYVAVHESRKKRTITGCVVQGGNGMSLTDEKDKRSYTLSGNTADIKPGDRMSLQGKKIKPKDAGKPVVWETGTISKDFGPCQPRA